MKRNGQSGYLTQPLAVGFLADCYGLVMERAAVSARQCDIDELDGMSAVATAQGMTRIPDPGDQLAVAWGVRLALWNRTFRCCDSSWAFTRVPLRLIVPPYQEDDNNVKH